jgi:hypothetical protein
MTLYYIHDNGGNKTTNKVEGSELRIPLISFS